MHDRNCSGPGMQLQPGRSDHVSHIHTSRQESWTALNEVHPIAEGNGSAARDPVGLPAEQSDRSRADQLCFRVGFDRCIIEELSQMQPVWAKNWGRASTALLHRLNDDPHSVLVA